MPRFFCDCDCDFDVCNEIAAIFWVLKVPFPPGSLAMFPCDGRSRVAIFRGKKRRRPHCVLAGDGDVCDRKSRRFAIVTCTKLRAFFCSKNSCEKRIPRPELGASMKITLR